MTPLQPSVIPYSRSLILAIRRCPRQAYLTYFKRLTPDAPHPGLQSPYQSPHLAIGQAVHTAAEILTKDLTVPLDEIHTAMLNIPEFHRGRQNGWSQVMAPYKEAFEAHLGHLAFAMAWVLKKQLLPRMLESNSYTVEAVEKELKPIVHVNSHTQDTFAFQSRTDAVFRDAFNSPVIGSLKTSTVFSTTAARMQEYDTQGLTESLAYYLETGEWPDVQMYTVYKGKTDKLDGTIRFSGPLTTVYRKVYKDGGVAWSPKYTSGWDVLPAEDYPGGLEAYLEECLAPHPAVEKTYSIAMAVRRDHAAAEEALSFMQQQIEEFYYRGQHERMHAAHHENCFSFGGLCGFHGPCQKLILLESLNYQPRVPHHPGLEANDE